MNGYALRIKIIRVIDGDTVVVRALGGPDGVVLAYQTTLFECPVGSMVKLRTVIAGMEANVRLQGFSAPELKQPGGEEAKQDMIKVLRKNEGCLWLFIERPKDTNKNGIIDLPEILRQRVSFCRIVGRIMAGGFDDGCQNVVDMIP